MPRARIIAIDGPAASGKSTLGQRLAARLGYLFFDTGAMYRALTLAALRSQIDTSDKHALGRLADKIHIDVCPASVADERQCDVLLDGEDVTWAIRGEDIDAHVSLVSSYKEVREALGRRQREIGLRGSVVMVGRDIGTVILPEADLKIYLDASVEERSRRRHQEILERGEQSSYEEVLQAMRERDRFDSTRDLAPLSAAPEAIVIDSTAMTIDEALEMLLELVQNLDGRESCQDQEGAIPPKENRGDTLQIIHGSEEGMDDA